MDILLRIIIPSSVILLIVGGCFLGYLDDRRVKSKMTKEEIAKYEEEMNIESQWW